MFFPLRSFRLFSRLLLDHLGNPHKGSIILQSFAFGFLGQAALFEF